MWRGVFVLVGLGIAACSSDSDDTGQTGAPAVSECKSQFSRDKGYGFENDFVVTASPPDGGPAPPPDPEVLLAEVVAECQAAGVGECNASSFLTREGAFCVARSQSFPEGLRPWQAGILFDIRQKRVIWTVQNTLHESPDGARGGDAWTFDAVTGALLSREGWSAIP